MLNTYLSIGVAAGSNGLWSKALWVVVDAMQLTVSVWEDTSTVAVETVGLMNE